jgi:phenylpropionate dioxygenase-like ring-hydroxylating dioxygenase large terminal subunit
MSAELHVINNPTSKDGWPDSWKLLSHGIRSGRYTDPAFAQLEFQKLWSRVWQAAARLDEIQKPGDYTTYTIGDQSVMIVRVDAATVKAFYNVCPHRGTALTGSGCGHFRNEKIICPFHGWRWDTAGNSEFVLEREQFRDGKLTLADVSLKEIKHVAFAGFVFINFDPNPQPFEEFIAPVRNWLETLAIDQMRHYWWKAIPVNANWKVAQEAFLEGYHVPATHPQLEVRAAEVIFDGRPESDVDFAHQYVAYDAWAHGHGRFYPKMSAMQGNVKVVSGDPVETMAARLNLLAEGMDAQILAEDVEIARSLKKKPIPEGSSIGAEWTRALFARAAEQQRPMPTMSAETMGMWGGEIFIFPNLLILPFAGNAMMYRVRPDGNDPDRCIFEILSTKSYPAAQQVPAAVVQHVTDVDDPTQVLKIPRQDLGNIPRMQKGLHQGACKQIWLAVEQEKLIMNMHTELDRYLRA